MSKKKRKLGKIKSRRLMGLGQVTPRAAAPRPFTATRITRVIPTHIEGDRRSH